MSCHIVLERLTVFFCFICQGHLDVVALLINHGAEVTCKDKKGYTPLHAAASNGQINVVKHLLNLGVEVSADAYIAASSCFSVWVFFPSEGKSRLHFYRSGEKLISLNHVFLSLCGLIAGNQKQTIDREKYINIYLCFLFFLVLVLILVLVF